MKPDEHSSNPRHDAARQSGAARDDIRPLDRIPIEQLRLFLKGFRGDWRPDTDENKGVPPPPAHKPCPADAERVDLPAPATLPLGRTPFATLAAQRRSCRTHARDALSREELSFLLWCTQGISAVAQDPAHGTACHLRTVPSAGGRNPFETYLLIHRVEDLLPGVYRFLPLEHKLLPLCEPRDFSQALRMICYGQDQVRDAAAVFVWAAVPYRMEWRYGYIAHRMIAIEAGHICQNLHLAAASIGAGACAISGYDQTLIDRLINVDGRNEFAVYLATAGKVP